MRQRSGDEAGGAVQGDESIKLRRANEDADVHEPYRRRRKDDGKDRTRARASSRVASRRGCHSQCSGAGLARNGDSIVCIIDPPCATGSRLNSSKVIAAVNAGHLEGGSARRLLGLPGGVGGPSLPTTTHFTTTHRTTTHCTQKKPRLTYHHTHPTSTASPPAPYRASSAPGSSAGPSRPPSCCSTGPCAASCATCRRGGARGRGGGLLRFCLG